MRLGLSSAAAPDAGLDELLAAVVRRGLLALELREGDGHGVAPADGTMVGMMAARRAAALGVALSGYRSAALGDDGCLARLCEALGAPVLVDAPEDIEGRIARARRLEGLGAAAVVVIRGESAVDQGALADAAGLGLAWDADPALGRLGSTAEGLLQRFPAALRQLRLIGGGPEADLQHGAGIGALMRRLALAGYGGSLLLAPSSPRYRVAWANWLGRRGGWGCGSKVRDPSLVGLEGPRIAGGAN